MAARPVDDKPSETLVVVPGDGFWTGSSTLPHLHHFTMFSDRHWLVGRPGAWTAGFGPRGHV